MSELILPDSVKASGFIAGRRLKRIEYLEAYFGCVIVLKHPSERAKSMAPHLPNTGACGIMQTLLVQDLDRKRAKALVVFSPAGPGAIVPIPAEVLEESDPWAMPPGIPDRAESMLEE